MKVSSLLHELLNNATAVFEKCLLNVQKCKYLLFLTVFIWMDILFPALKKIAGTFSLFAIVFRVNKALDI